MQIAYINADDNPRGIAEKQRLLQPMGIMQLVPGHQGFEAEHVWELLQTSIADGSAPETILVLDTLKKWTDLFDAKSIARVTEELRRFVAVGGTVIALGHTNKNKDENGHPIYKGTTDVLDDWDCGWIGEPFLDGEVEGLTLKVLKRRGGQPDSASFRWSKSRDYQTKFSSVERVPDEELDHYALVTRGQMIAQEHAVAVDAITSKIEKGVNTKTQLVGEVAAEINEGKDYVRSVLDMCTGAEKAYGKLWTLTKGAHNRHLYEMNK